MMKLIESNLGNEFEKELFKAAMYNLEDKNNLLRLNNFSYAIRELSRHILYRLAPEEEVKKCSWYTTLTDNDKPTRVQRMQFAVYGGIENNLLEEIGLYPEEIEADIKELNKTISSLSSFTHVNPKSFKLEDSVVNTFTETVLKTLAEFIKNINKLRESVTSRLEDVIIDKVTDEAIFNNYENIGSLAPHFSLDGSEVHHYKVQEITNEEIHFEVEGSVDVTLMYGSKADRRENDGLDITQNFIFETIATFKIHESLNEIVKNPKIIPFGVDTSDWYGQEE